MVDSDNSIPEQREPDPVFDPAERLYRRIPLKDVDAGEVSDASIPSPAFSVDRSKYLIGSPGVLIRQHPDKGLARVVVGDIPPSVQSDQGERYDFGVEHRPEPGHYSHSEVHSYRSGIRLADIEKEPPRHVRKKFRDLLRRKFKILDPEELEEEQTGPVPEETGPTC